MRPSPSVPLTGIGAAIASLAMLKVNADEGHDYVDGFVPFARECLRLAPQREVSLEELDGCLRREFGFSVPLPALKTILHRAARDGLVELDHGIYLRTSAVEAAGNFPAERAEAQRQYKALTDRLCSFAKAHDSLQWASSEAETALFDYLRLQAVPTLQAIIEGTQPRPEPQTSTPTAQYVVSAFVLDLAEGDPEYFGYLETFVKGAMLSSVLFYPTLGEAERRFDHLDAYFDTPILLRAIGAHGPVAERAARQLIELSYELGARAMCFRSTFDETMGVLNGAAATLRRYGSHALDPSETVEYLLEAGYTSSDVELMIARLARVLRSLRVQIVDRPAPVAQLTVDESEFERVLQEEVHYKHGGSLKHDLDAATAVYRLRGGQNRQALEDAGAIFITTNAALCRGIRSFFSSAASTHGVPLAFLDHHFGTLLWLKKPAAAPDLPRDLLIASCFAALNPPTALWQRYLREIDRLRQKGDLTEDDYHLLRFDLGSRSSLLTLTGGRQEAFVEGAVPQILARARAHARREVEREAHAAGETIERLQAALESQTKRDESDLEARRVRYRIIGNAVGTSLRWFILGLGFIVAVVLGIVSVLATTGWLLVVLAIPAAVASGLGVLDKGPGRMLKTWALAADVGASKYLARRIEGWVEGSQVHEALPSAEATEGPAISDQRDPSDSG